jgi:hypothetical protein
MHFEATEPATLDSLEPIGKLSIEVLAFRPPETSIVRARHAFCAMTARIIGRDDRTQLLQSLLQREGGASVIALAANDGQLDGEAFLDGVTAEEQSVAVSTLRQPHDGPSRRHVCRNLAFGPPATICKPARVVPSISHRM